MTGYQETLTDPSYARQIVAMTAPHIGNTGVNDTDPESRRIWVSGYVVREPARIASSWRAQRSLQDELAAQGITGIAMHGTRALTRHLRDQGAMRAGISAVTTDPAEVLQRVLASPPMTGADLAREVSTPRPYVVHPPDGTPFRFRVVAVDLGIKAATPRAMAALGCEVRALGLGTYKLRFGHRGVNQPVQDLRTGRVQITSHNHGFAVSLPAGAGEPGAVFDTDFGPAQITHVNLNDGVVEGLRLLDAPAFSVQYHPEAAPGPHDASGLFAEFCELMEARHA